MPEKQKSIEIKLFFGFILVSTLLNFEFKNQLQIVLEASWRPDWAVLSGTWVTTACFEMVLGGSRTLWGRSRRLQSANH